MQTPEAGSAAVFIHRFDTHVPLAIERYGPDRLGEKYFRGIVTVEQAVFAAFLEFQTTVDRYMAVRLLACVSLLYQGLIRAGQLPASGKLPPVVPIGLYNGRGRWTAPLNVTGLMESVPGSLV